MSSAHGKEHDLSLIIAGGKIVNEINELGGKAECGKLFYFRELYRLDCASLNLITMIVYVSYLVSGNHEIKRS